MSDEKENIKIEISNHIIKAVAKALLPEIQSYYINYNSSISEIKEMDEEESKVKPSA